MGMPDVARIWTRAEVLALPDDGHRYELVDGELLVTPSPSGLHQRAVLELFRLVDAYVRAHRLGYTCLSPADLDLQSGQLVQPDLFVGALVGGREPVHWSDYRIPILVAEVLSPSSARYDAFTKRRRYQRAGVPTYWVINPDASLVDVWTPSDERPMPIVDQLVWRPAAPVPPLAIDLPTYFRSVRGG